MISKGWILATALLAAGTAQATCYSVHKADGTLIFESSTTPVNLALPFGDTVPEKFGPGALMVMSDPGVFCKERAAVLQTQEAAVSAAPVKQRAEVKAEAPVEHQPTDEELLALKPEEIAPTPPVQPVEVKVVEAAGERPMGEAMKAQQGMGVAGGNVAVRGE
jgi:hypothetical protein